MIFKTALRITSKFAKKPHMRFRQKMAEQIEAAKEQLEQQIFDPNYDASVEDTLIELAPDKIKEWESSKQRLVDKDMVMDFARDISLNYEEVVTEKKLDSLREKMI